MVTRDVTLPFNPRLPLYRLNQQYHQNYSVYNPRPEIKFSYGMLQECKKWVFIYKNIELLFLNSLQGE